MENEKEKLERARLEREYKRLDMLESKRYSYKPHNDYKTAYMVSSIGILIACLGLLAYLVGNKSKKDTCKC